MEAQPSRKRSISDEDDDFNKPPAQKRVRFPKGKKVNPGDEVVNVSRDSEDGPSEWADPLLVAKARSKRKNQNNVGFDNEENRDILHDVSAAEMSYEDNETFIDDGIQFEPFNLEKEREEGYFDKSGNYVEYIHNKEIKDAWLDSVDVDPNLAQRNTDVTNNVDDTADLTTEEIGNIKRRIADALEPGETVLQALRRMKGSSNNRKEKMSAETKRVFDQLTEDAMKLMEDGDYNVYDEKQEAFQREADGFERLARARGEGTRTNSGNRQPDSTVAEDFVSNGAVAADISSSNGGDSFDMFSEDGENATDNPASGGENLFSGPNLDIVGQLSESGGAMQNDYVFDESSGYYYSSSLGYYYDPSSGLYCSASSGQWYSYNEEIGAYEEMPVGEANTTT